MSDGALDAIERLLEAPPDADDVLRAVVRTLTDDPGVVWAAIVFNDAGDRLLGPTAGEADESRRTRTPIEYRGAFVGELWVDGRADPTLLERVAELVATHVLLGWDTGGETWEP